MNKDKIHAIAGITNASLMQDVKGEIAKAVESGMDIEYFKKNFENTLLRHGWGSETKEEYDLTRAWRMELILRQNMQNEYNAGRYEEMMKRKSSEPFWKYQTMEDARVRPAHQLLNGIIKPYNDDFWSIFYPCNGYNCRCTVVSLPYSEESVEYSKTDVVFDPIEREFYRNGQVIRPDEGFENNPNDPLQINYSIYDRDIANEAKKFVESLRNGEL